MKRTCHSRASCRSVAALLFAVAATTAGTPATAQSIDRTPITRVLSVYDTSRVLPVPDTVTLDVAAPYRDARVIRRALVRPPTPEAAPGAVVRPRPPTKLQRTLYWLSVAASATAATWDVYTTDRNLATGLFREGNPILAYEDGRFNKPVKIAVSVGVPVAAHGWLWLRGRRWQAIGVNAATATAWGAAAAHNTRLYYEVTAEGRVTRH